MLAPVSKNGPQDGAAPGTGGGGTQGKSYKSRVENCESCFDAYLDQVRSAHGRSTYPERVPQVSSTDMELVDPSTQKIPLCQTALVTVDGLQCAVIDTNLRSDDISLNELKAIVNPFNWNENYPAFFREMAPFA